MKKEEKATRSQLKYLLLFSITLSVIVFLGVLYMIQERNIETANVILERYAIIITIIGIPLSLKLFHNRISKINKEDTVKYLKKYKFEYIIRLGILEFVYLFNLISLYITGTKNFTFMIIITIFAFFLCFPQKTNLERNELDNN